MNLQRAIEKGLIRESDLSGPKIFIPSLLSRLEISSLFSSPIEVIGFSDEEGIRYPRPPLFIYWSRSVVHLFSSSENMLTMSKGLSFGCNLLLFFQGAVPLIIKFFRNLLFLKERTSPIITLYDLSPYYLFMVLRLVPWKGSDKSDWHKYFVDWCNICKICSFFLV